MSYYTIPQVCAQVRCSHKSVHRAVQEGEIKGELVAVGGLSRRDSRYRMKPKKMEWHLERKSTIEWMNNYVRSH